MKRVVMKRQPPMKDLYDCQKEQVIIIKDESRIKKHGTTDRAVMSNSDSKAIRLWRVEPSSGIVIILPQQSSPLPADDILRR